MKHLIYFFTAFLLVRISSGSVRVNYEGCRIQRGANGSDKEDLYKRGPFTHQARMREALSVHSCVYRCFALRYLVAGMQNGTFCLCGSNIRDTVKVKEEYCYERCPGNCRQRCGGLVTMSVYQTGYKKEPNLHFSEDILRRGRIACFRESALGYVCTNQEEKPLLRSPRMTPQVCSLYCSSGMESQKLPIAALKSAEECCCGRSRKIARGAVGKVSWKYCQEPCVGLELSQCVGRIKDKNNVIPTFSAYDTAELENNGMPVEPLRVFKRKAGWQAPNFPPLSELELKDGIFYAEDQLRKLKEQKSGKKVDDDADQRLIVKRSAKYDSLMAPASKPAKEMPRTRAHHRNKRIKRSAQYGSDISLSSTPAKKQRGNRAHHREKRVKKSSKNSFDITPTVNESPRAHHREKRGKRYAKYSTNITPMFKSAKEDPKPHHREKRVKRSIKFSSHITPISRSPNEDRRPHHYRHKRVKRFAKNDTFISVLSASVHENFGGKMALRRKRRARRSANEEDPASRVDEQPPPPSDDEDLLRALDEEEKREGKELVSESPREQPIVDPENTGVNIIDVPDQEKSAAGMTALASFEGVLLVLGIGAVIFKSRQDSQKQAMSPVAVAQVPSPVKMPAQALKKETVPDTDSITDTDTSATPLSSDDESTISSTE